MYLLRRSTDLDKTVGIEEAAVSESIDGGVLIVETQPRELDHLAVILKSLDLRTQSVREDSAALRIVSAQLPRMVVSSRELPGLKGYDLRHDLPETAPYVYFRRSSQVEKNGSSGEKLLNEVEVSVVLAAAKEEVPPVSAGREDSDGEGLPATAEEIVKGFRDLEPDEEVDRSDEAARSLEFPVKVPEEEEGLSQIQRFRAEYQARQSTDESIPADTMAGFSDPRSHQIERNEEAKLPRQDLKQEKSESEPPILQDELIPPDPEDYSIIEKIDAEEITKLSHNDVLSEKSAKPDHSHSEELYQVTRTYVLDSIRAVDAGKIPDLVEGESIAERVVSSVEDGSELLLSATDRGQEFAISSHSVNTAVFAVRIAISLGLSRWQQLRIALASLLHEIGVVRLPKQLVYKTEKPTLEEIKILRQRPVYAARSLKGVDSRYDWLSEVVGQVYERENGTGHPLGLTGREICEEAKVIGIADLFDACIHRRPYREALTGYQALFELTTDQARTFSDRIVKALIKSLSLFPYNEYVVLSSGEIGKVVEINLENLSRPVVEVIYDKEGVKIGDAESIDLAQNPSLYISKALPYRNLPAG
jgi:HD-GYP domain-containing protein (c-di-GMP phosphodiesterase class II)